MRVVLGIESSCDETAAALVSDGRVILAQRIASQDEEHRPFGGVVPEIAARAHAERLTPLIAATLADAGMTLADVDAVAATAGPGLIGGVMVGLVTAKALAMAGDKPLIAINHLEGHALSPRLADATLEFPYLLLLASGGHCQLLLVQGVGRYRRLATTIDDAAGEAFDKTAKVLGLGFPGGPAAAIARRLRSITQSMAACWKAAAISASAWTAACFARSTALFSPANEKCGSFAPSKGRGSGTARASPSRASRSTAGPPG